MFVTRHVLIEKQGNAREECEDAIAINTTKGRFAVADGATESFDSRTWAKLLVKAWVLVSDLPSDPSGFLSTVQRLGEWLSNRWKTRPLPWYAEAKLQLGSYAAIVGLSIAPQPNAEGKYEWSVVALGDSCMILERSGGLIEAFPINYFEQFSYHPVLLPSVQPATIKFKVNRPVIHSGQAKSGDVFLLLSDAIACWYLVNAEQDETRLAKFHEVLEQGDEKLIRDFIDLERLSGNLRNDDVAVVRIQILDNLQARSSQPSP